MSSILACVAAAAYTNDHLPYYGAIELEEETGDTVWLFDSTETDMDVPRLYNSSNGAKHQGFRPSSVERLDDGKTLVSGWRSAVWVDEDGDMDRREQHKLMNDVHEIQRTDKGTYLVSSTGMDTILEFDEDWNEMWRWHMWKNVPRSTRPDGYYPDQMTDLDTRNLALSPDNRYHLNYATYIEKDVILVSALNYGVFTIDRNTGEVTKSITRLDECHNPYPMQDLVIIPESGKDRIVAADWDGDISPLFAGGLSFVKDADPINHTDKWLITDTKNNRILIWHLNKSEPHKEYFLGEDALPYEADYLKGGDSFA